MLIDGMVMFGKSMASCLFHQDCLWAKKKTKKGKTIKKLNERKENGCLSLPAMCILMFDQVVEYSTEAAMSITQFDEDRHLDYK